MADSKRQQVVDAINTQLQTILTANSYETDAGGNVYEWRDTDRSPFEADEVADGAINFRDTDDPIAVTVGQDEHNLLIEIDAYANTTSAIRKLAADILTAMAEDKTFGGLCEDTSELAQDMSVEHGEKRVFKAALRFKVEYRTDHMDAYN
jgi:hypothetical protein